jgi:hypothetical protein
MKRPMVLALLLFFAALPAFGRGSHSHYSTRSRSTGTVYSRGYVRKNGTYVQPHYSSHPNRTQRDNFSAKGNVNPYTGRVGTKKATH